MQLSRTPKSVIKSYHLPFIPGEWEVQLKLRKTNQRTRFSHKGLNCYPLNREAFDSLAVCRAEKQMFVRSMLCRSAHLKESWTECAKKVKLDVGKINSIAKSDEGKKLFRENIQKSNELKITSSPTLVVNGKIVDRQLFAKQIQGNCGL